MQNSNDKRLFWACFISLIATAFGFIIRAMIMNEWAQQFGLSETQKGEIFGVGLWPFAISIVLFSLVIDWIGYGRAMIFAFVCHIASAIITICAPMVLAGDGASAEEVAAGQRAGYWMLYLGNFVVALGNGTVEAVINPVVATMFAREKTKWLNILHAGWPGGLVLGGLLTIALSETGLAGMFLTEPVGWQFKVALIFIPALIYGVMMLGCRFPVQERVAAGVSYKEMLSEAGGLGAFIVLFLIFGELFRVFNFNTYLSLAPHYNLIAAAGVAAVIAIGFGLAVQSFGRPMFALLLFIMIPLATTELGTDSWITPLMEDLMKEIGVNAGWVLVYTSFIMMVLRFFAGAIVHRLSPLGLLAASCVVAALGLFLLSNATGMAIFLAATVYGFGKTFFWPTMLGVVAERFPKGGALTLNATGGVGMLGVGVLGAVFLGYYQDTQIDQRLVAHDEQAQTSLHSEILSEDAGIFGNYLKLDQDKLDADTPEFVAAEARKGEIEETLKAENKDSKENLAAALDGDEKYQELVSKPDYAAQADVVSTVSTIVSESKRAVLRVSMIFPLFMLACYLALIVWFKLQGGYEAEVLTGHEAKDDEYTGGVEGPMEA